MIPCIFVNLGFPHTLEVYVLRGLVGSEGRVEMKRYSISSVFYSNAPNFGSVTAPQPILVESLPKRSPHPSGGVGLWGCGRC